MTSLKPQLIRADTLDLQSPDTPSAKDHSRQPAHPPLGRLGPPARHQNQTLRTIEQDALQEQMSSPMVVHDHDHTDFSHEPEFYDDQDDDSHGGSQMQDGQTIMQAGDDSGVDDSDIGDQGDDDGMDDDLMDKISSSPSIDDGNSPISVLWPSRVDSVRSGAAHFLPSAPRHDEPPPSSAPSVSSLEHYPIHFCSPGEQTPPNHHGKYAASGPRIRDSWSAGGVESPEDSKLAQFQEVEEEEDVYEDSLGIDDIHSFLLPLDDPLLGVDEDTHFNHIMVEGPALGESDWEDEDSSEMLKADLSSDDDSQIFLFTDDSRFIDSGWGGECLREVEDIDFEFVYALHTFVATVEGQANATKGDTMVLLDDSNSYWWLVRVVKDGSIGYLPAEHIETPTERLARLNKHRNIDLSATMLGDNPEKSKNPLKMAIRRRNAKTVQFAPPQYFEPSDFEYSEDEEGTDGDLEQGDMMVGTDGQDITQVEDSEGGVAGTGIRADQNGQLVNGVQPQNSNDNSYGETRLSAEKSRASDELSLEDRPEDPNGRSARGLIRNSDSFFKDDGGETKKISLTPRLLRADPDLNLPAQQAEVGPKISGETFDRLVSPDSEKHSDEKKKKEKKGMLGGLFKRKDKKGKGHDVDPEDGKKASDEFSRASPQSKKSSESLAQEAKHGKGEKSPQRQTSKLQKQPRSQLSPKASPLKERNQSVEQSSHLSMDSTMSPSSQESSSTPSTLRSPIVDSSRAPENLSPRIGSPEAPPERASSPHEKRSIFTSMTNALKPVMVPSTNTEADAGESKPVVVVGKGKDRGELVERFSEEDDEGRGATPVNDGHQVRHVPPSLITPSHERHPNRLSESPIEVSPIEPPESQKSSTSQPPMLMVDTSSNSERRSVSPISPTSSSSPSLVDADTETANDGEDMTSPTATSPQGDALTPSTARSTPTWSDASLRMYMDNDNDIRDLLIIVHDKSNVLPAGPDHPITGNIFGAEKGRLAEMQSHLDSMLSGWLARKNQMRLSG